MPVSAHNVGMMCAWGATCCVYHALCAYMCEAVNCYGISCHHDMSQCVADMSQWGNVSRRSILYPHRGWWLFYLSNIGRLIASPYVTSLAHVLRYLR